MRGLLCGVYIRAPDFWKFSSSIRFRMMLPQNGPKIVPKWPQNNPQMVPKWSQNGPPVIGAWMQETTSTSARATRPSSAGWRRKKTACAPPRVQVPNGCNTYIHIHTYIYIYIYMYMFLHTYIYIYTYIYMYISYRGYSLGKGGLPRRKGTIRDRYLRFLAPEAINSMVCGTRNLIS